VHSAPGGPVHANRSMPDRYAVIGNPVSHSKSPRIHAEFARQTGEDIVYGALYSPLDEFEALVTSFRCDGGRGLNVTLPFKHRAYALADRRTARAEQAKAVNTFAFERGGVTGDNTDGWGLVRDLTGNLGLALRGTRVLVMGAGGAAYGVCGPLLDEQPQSLVVANRTIAKAVALCSHLRSAHPHPEALAPAEYAALEDETFDLVINATSAGLAEAMPPLPEGVLRAGVLAYDMVYGRDTPFMACARAAGAAVADGLGMLVEQAAESFRVWRGVRPHTGPVIAMLRAL
jgi:shikimate dehydrogenase